jgi:hypothetical protein
MMAKAGRARRSTGEQTTMENRKCPMCQCEQFYKSGFGGPAFYAPLSFWITPAPVHGLVCLNCGFVALQVDRAVLEKIREKARKEGRMIDGNPGKEELREL